MIDAFDGLRALANEESLDTAEEGTLRVWWIPQIPGKAFHRIVEDIIEAKRLLRALAAYDAFQLVNNIKPDYCNIGGLEVFDDGEWVEGENHRGETVDEVER